VKETSLPVKLRRALASGALYEGVIPLVVGASPAQVSRALRRMEERGEVVYDHQTWQLAK
jgi:hypothetical protein